MKAEHVVDLRYWSTVIWADSVSMHRGMDRYVLLLQREITVQQNQPIQP